MSSSAEQDENPEEISLLPIQQLVSFWRERAERVRSQSPPMETRAEVFEMCAAQLADALASLAPDASVDDDPSSLELFQRTDALTDEEA